MDRNIPRSPHKPGRTLRRRAGMGHSKSGNSAETRDFAEAVPLHVAALFDLPIRNLRAGHVFFVEFVDSHAAALKRFDDGRAGGGFLQDDEHGVSGAKVFQS